MKKTLIRTPKPQTGLKTISFRARLGSGLVLLALVAGISLTASRPAHTAGGPIAVNVANTPLSAIIQDSDNPARQPVVVTQNIFGAASVSGIFQNLYTVPAGKRLVVDYVTASPEFPGDNNSYHYSISASQGGQPNYAHSNELPDSALYSTMSQKVQLFADAGTTVTLVTSSNQKNSVFLDFTMTGHLVDLP